MVGLFLLVCLFGVFVCLGFVWFCFFVGFVCLLFKANKQKNTSNNQELRSSNHATEIAKIDICYGGRYKLLDVHIITYKIAKFCTIFFFQQEIHIELPIR